MIVLGVVLLVVAFLLGIHILYTLGVALCVIGVVLLVLGGLGHTVGPRRYYF